MKRAAIQLTLSLAILAAAIVVTEQVDVRVDLTEDQRHSFRPATEVLLDQLDADGRSVLVRCYLEGDFPAAYRRLADEIRGILRSFNRMSGGEVKFEFIDVAASGDPKTTGEVELALYDQGLRFSRISYRSGTTTAYQNVWACALLTVDGVDHPIQFLSDGKMEPGEQAIQNAINQLEFTISSALRKGLRSAQPVVGFLRSHGTFKPVELADFTESLRDFADVVDVELNGSVDALCQKIEGMSGRLPRFDALVVAGPDSTFTDRDKLLLDQYLMHGGCVLWLVDPIRTDLDSLRSAQTTVGVTRELGVYDLLFHYGARLNRDLVLDAQCKRIMLDAGPSGGGNGRGFDMFSWYFAPLAIAGHQAHPIASNLDPVHFDFVSSIDTVNPFNGVAKTVLLQSSFQSIRYNAPVRVATAVVNLPPAHFEAGPGTYPMAVLLEGEFESFFESRLLSSFREDPDFAYRALSRPTAMIVVSDADIARNKVRTDIQGQDTIQYPMPLGYDAAAQGVVYDNKEFLLNAMSYLLDDQAAISLRSRTIELRPLDQSRTLGRGAQLSGLALGLPLAWVLLSCGAVRWRRSRKFNRRAQ